MNHLRAVLLLPLLAGFAMLNQTRAESAAPAARFRLLTLDPGHFHASLVQKFMYADVDPAVHVYAPESADVDEHLKRIERFNARPDQPTHWREEVYRGPDFLERMLADRAGNVVVISGNNAHKTEYIVRAVEAGFHVLGDKPMAVTPAEFTRLEQAFATAAGKHVLLYDIMTERFEITNRLQRDFSQVPALFGTIVPGTPDDPAVTMESVHYFSKIVAGAPLLRPAWFFDVRQEGEALTDVGTHLFDLVQWELFPSVLLRPADVEVLGARRWATPITREQFGRVTGLNAFPEYLNRDVVDGVLQEFANGECTYRIRGVTARVVAEWRFETATGGDTHHSVLRGTGARLEIRQTAAENFKPILYVRAADKSTRLPAEATITSAIAGLQAKYPGVGYRRAGDAWAITVPASYDVGHEAHFAQVTENFLSYLRGGGIPDWEVAAMLTKYATTTRAFALSHGK